MTTINKPEVIDCDSAHPDPVKSQKKFTMSYPHGALAVLTSTFSWVWYNRDKAGKQPESNDSDIVMNMPSLIKEALTTKLHTPDIQADTGYVMQLGVACVVVFLVSMVMYILYRWEKLSEIPTLQYFRTKKILTILEKMGPIDPFFPAPWFSTGDIQTILFAIWPLHVMIGWGKYKVKFDRELVTIPDGGVIALDWYRCDSEDDTTPIIIILPGVVGTSTDMYAKRLALRLKKRKYHTVIKSWRGLNAPMPKPLPETWCERAVTDLDYIVRHIRRCNKKAPILFIGVSYGGYLTQSYLGYLKDHGTPENNVIGGVSVSGCFEGKSVYHKGLKTHPTFDLALSLSLRKDMSLHFDTLVAGLEALGDTDTKKNYDRLNNLTRFLQWHDTISRKFSTVPADNVLDYFEQVDTYHVPQLRNTCRPCLCLLAKDDPICPDAVTANARKAALQSDNIILVDTLRGGHCGFFTGFWGHSWGDDMCLKFLDALLATEEEEKTTMQRISNSI